MTTELIGKVCVIIRHQSFFNGDMAGKYRDVIKRYNLKPVYHTYTYVGYLSSEQYTLFALLGIEHNRLEITRAEQVGNEIAIIEGMWPELE